MQAAHGATRIRCWIHWAIQDDDQVNSIVKTFHLTLNFEQTHFLSGHFTSLWLLKSDSPYVRGWIISTNNFFMTQVPSSKTAAHHPCMWHSMCWKVHNCHSACSAPQSPKRVTGLFSFSQGSFPYKTHWALIIDLHQIVLWCAHRPLWLYDRRQIWCTNSSGRQQSNYTVIPFTFCAKTLSPSSSSTISFLFEGFEILYIFVTILVDLWQCPSCINTCVGERLCVAWGAGHRVLSRMSYCAQRSSSLLLFPNLSLVPRCCYFMGSTCQVILWRTQADRLNLGSAGLDGDLKKAMKDGKPVIIEVRLRSLKTLFLICKQSK